jgi:small-conductance mechanosensitive channel
MLKTVRAVENVLLEPPPDVIVDSLGDSGVNLKVRVWIGDAASERQVEAGVLEHCKIALDQAGIQIPFPHLQVFVDSVEEKVWERLSALRSGGG